MIKVYILGRDFMWLPDQSPVLKIHLTHRWHLKCWLLALEGGLEVGLRWEWQRNIELK